MARIPTVTPSPSLNTPAVAVPQAVNPMADEFGRIGAEVQNLAAGWATMQNFAAEKSWQDFKFQEAQRYADATKALAPENAAGFATTYDQGYRERVAKWQQSNLPGGRAAGRSQWDNRSGDLRLNLYGDAANTEAKLQNEFVTSSLDGTFSTNISPRTTQIAQLPDDAAKATALDALVEDAYATIDASSLSGEAKAAAKVKWRAEIQDQFAKSLPPAERQRLDPTTPDETVVDRIIGVEGVRKNPDSSATGPGQFIDSTWLRMIKQYKPDIAARLTDKQILDLRTGPMAASLGREMVRAYTQENGAYLQYHKIDATAGNLYLAHFLGAQGAVDVLSAAPDAIAADLAPAAAKANPTVFYRRGPGGDLVPRTAGEIAQWAGSLMAGTYHTDWGRHLDTIPFDQKVAIALDGSREYVQQQTETQKAAKDAYDAQLNSAKNGVMDGTFGLSDLYDARKSWLSDANDAHAVQTLIQERDKQALDLAGAQALIQGSGDINPFDTEQAKAVNLWYKKLAGGGADLFETDAKGVNQGAVTLRAVMERTGMVPDAATTQLQSGLWGTDATRRDRAITIMDGLSRENPAAYNRAFSENDRKRVDIYQQLAPLAPPDVLAQEMNPLVPPQEMAARDKRRSEGDKLAGDIKDSDILGSFDQTWTWGGTPGAPADPLAQTALRSDFNTAFAEAYTRVPDKDKAKDLALKWIKDKWGPTDTGSGGAQLMPYPPERYYPQIDGSHQWLTDQLDEQVKKEFPNASDYWLVSGPATEADVSGKAPPSYQVGVMDADGQFKVLHMPVIAGPPDERTVTYSAAPAVVRFDYQTAAGTNRAAFARRRVDTLSRNIAVPQAAQTPAEAGSATTAPITSPMNFPSSSGGVIEDMARMLQSIPSQGKQP